MLLGEQVPQYLLVPPAKSSAGQEAVDLAASAGLVLEPHQELVLEGALGERRDGRWAASEGGVVEPRQNGKGGIITARELAGLYLFGDELQTHTAHRFDTCLEGFIRIRDLIVNTPDLSRRVRRINDSHGQEAIELFNPTQRLLFKARSKGSGRGFSGDVVYLDEAFWLLELGNLVPTMSARPNPQLWYLSSAPLPRVESDVLRRLCKRGRAGATAKGRKRGRLAYFEWCARVKTDPAKREAWLAEVAGLLDDPRAVAQANPGLGYRLPLEFIQETERPAMDAEEYARERLGIWPDVEAPPELAIDMGDWRACEERGSKAADPVVLAFEVSHDRKWSVIGAAGAPTGGVTHVEVVENRPRTGWVVERLVELKRSHRVKAIVCNRSGPAGALLADCEEAGLEVEKVSGVELAQACGAALDDITEHRWRFDNQPELNKAARVATKRSSGDTFVFDRRAGSDISPLVAVTLAAWLAGREPEVKPKPQVHAWGDDDEEFNAILRELEEQEA